MDLTYSCYFISLESFYIQIMDQSECDLDLEVEAGR